MDSGGIGLELYLTRTHSIGTHVFGQEFYETLREMHELSRDWRSPELEVAEPLFRRALDLFAEGCERFQQDPTQYECLVTWTGPPNVRDSLIEQCVLFCEAYDDCVDLLIEKYLSSGNQPKALECERQMTRLRALLEGLPG